MSSPSVPGFARRFGWRPFAPFGAFAVAAFLFLFRLGGVPLIDPDEGRNARVAVEMREGGTWLVPTFDGLAYMDKPGTYFSVVAASLGLFGASESAARLPSAMCGMALLAVVFLRARGAYGPRTAALSVVILAASPLVLAFSRIVILDVFLALFTTGAILCGFESLSGRGARGRSLSAVSLACMAVATLIKGPVGFIVPIVVLAAVCLAARRASDLRHLFHPWGVLLFLGITLGWFLSVLRQRPDFAHYGLVEETMERYSTSAFRRTGPFWYYAAVGPAVFFPWSILAAAGLWTMRRRWRSAGPETRRLLVWAAAVILFFSTSSSKLPGYILTSIIASGVLVARLVDLALSGDARAGCAVRRGSWVAAGLSLAGAAALAILAAERGELHGLREQSVEWTRAGALVTPVAWTLAAMGFGFGAAALLRRPVLSVLAGCLLPVSLLTLCFPGVQVYARSASSQPLADLVSRQIADGACTRIAAVDCFPVGALYYLDRPVLLFSRDGHELTSEYMSYSLRRGADLSSRIRPTEDLEAWIESNTDCGAYLIGKGKSKPRLQAIASSRGARLVPLPRGYWGLDLPAAGADGK